MELKIREWFLPSQNHPNDFDILRNILLTTWLATYSSIVPPEELKKFLTLTCNDEKLTETFHNENIKGFIAEADGKPAAWLKTSTDTKENKFFVNQLYVLPEYQGKGIGTHLMNIAEEEARKNNFDKIWLGVMTENVPSVKWYKKLGFIFEEELPFTMVNTKINHLFGWKEISLKI